MNIDMLRELYERMALIRTFEATLEQLFQAGLATGTMHSCAGQEAIAVGVCACLGGDDLITGNHRSHGHYLARTAGLLREDNCPAQSDDASTSDTNDTIGGDPDNGTAGSDQPGSAGSGRGIAMYACNGTLPRAVSPYSKAVAPLSPNRHRSENLPEDAPLNGRPRGAFRVACARGSDNGGSGMGDVEGLLAEILGSSDGVVGGRGGSQHLCGQGFFSNGIQGSMIPVAVGMAMAQRRRRQSSLTVCFIGDGTLGQGVLYESMNLASLWKLPVLFVVENNRYAMSTSASDAVAGDMEVRARAFGIDTMRSFGNDVLAVYDTASQIADQLRTHSQPFFWVLDTYRLAGHSKSDDCCYRTAQEQADWSQQDPLRLAGVHMSQEQLDDIAHRCRERVCAAVRKLCPTFQHSWTIPRDTYVRLPGYTTTGSTDLQQCGYTADIPAPSDKTATDIVSAPTEAVPPDTTDSGCGPAKLDHTAGSDCTPETVHCRERNRSTAKRLHRNACTGALPREEPSCSNAVTPQRLPPQDRPAVPACEEAV